MQEDLSDKQTNFEIGKKFEGFVSNTIYPASQYNLISVSPEYNPRFVKDCMNPDLKLIRKNASAEFWVECKFRSNLRKDFIEFDEKQIDRYRKISEPITYIIGFGGTPDTPKIVFSIPFSEVFHKMEVSDLERYIFNIPLKIEKDSGEWNLKMRETLR